MEVIPEVPTNYKLVIPKVVKYRWKYFKFDTKGIKIKLFYARAYNLFGKYLLTHNHKDEGLLLLSTSNKLFQQTSN